MSGLMNILSVAKLATAFPQSTRRIAHLAMVSLVFCGAMMAAEPAQAARCRDAVCGSSTWDGKRVAVYLSNGMTGVTHYNFKTNPGEQIEIGGHYSFGARAGQSGTYSAQACRRGNVAVRSFCTAWATFRWRAF